MSFYYHPDYFKKDLYGWDSRAWTRRSEKTWWIADTQENQGRKQEYSFKVVLDDVISRSRLRWGMILYTPFQLSQSISMRARNKEKIKHISENGGTFWTLADWQIRRIPKTGNKFEWFLSIQELNDSDDDSMM